MHWTWIFRLIEIFHLRSIWLIKFLTMNEWKLASSNKILKFWLTILKSLREMLNEQVDVSFYQTSLCQKIHAQEWILSKKTECSFYMCYHVWFLQKTALAWFDDRKWLNQSIAYIDRCLTNHVSGIFDRMLTYLL